MKRNGGTYCILFINRYCRNYLKTSTYTSPLPKTRPDVQLTDFPASCRSEANVSFCFFNQHWIKSITNYLLKQRQHTFLLITPLFKLTCIITCNNSFLQDNNWKWNIIICVKFYWNQINKGFYFKLSTNAIWLNCYI